MFIINKFEVDLLLSLAPQKVLNLKFLDVFSEDKKPEAEEQHPAQDPKNVQGGEILEKY
jgi:hypothetical protein